MKNIIAVLCALFFVVACAGKRGSEGMGANGDVTPGSQMDLEVNVGDRVFFGFDSATIDSDAQATLSRQAAWLNANPAVMITVEGHCDQRGTVEYNLALGERRAHAVRAFLVASGISESRLKTISYGKERPAVEGNTEEAYAQNRRGVLIVN